MADVLHLNAVLLPNPEPVDVWIVDGRLTFERVADAQTFATGAFVVPGLVDAHCHIGLGVEGAVDDGTVRAQAAADVAGGTMLVRDCGVPRETKFLQSEAQAPRIIRAGRHIARTRRYIRNAAVEVEPDQLVEEVRRQARAGDGWVKLVGDWIDRSIGDLAPSFPADVAREAIAAAHDEGARVTAHCFAEQSVAELVEAGADCIEHGTGLDDEHIALMAERGVALVPTLINLDNFPMYAAQGKEKFPQYSWHMLALHAKRHETIGKAIEAGVPIYSGTDAGTVVKHGRIVDELEALAKLAGNDFALHCGSWGAREWLRADNLTEGASADFLVLANDPRINLATLRTPTHRVLRGNILRKHV